MKMKKGNNPDPKEILEMDYSSFVALVKERNRPSGGIKSVQEVSVQAHLNNQSKILEIGSNTGFTSINLGYLLGCEVQGIDINKESVKIAKASAIKNGLEDKVKFIRSSALNLPFRDSYFDLVWLSNVPSFITDKESAIKESLSVLRYGGTLCSIPIYYRKIPPKELVKSISKAIGCEITITTKKNWLDLFESIGEKEHIALELYFNKDFMYLNQEKRIDDYINMLLKKEHIANQDTKIKEAITKKAKYFYTLFNENLKYAGYSILLYQKRKEPEEMELFLTKPIKND